MSAPLMEQPWNVSQKAKLFHFFFSFGLSSSADAA